MCTIKKKRSFNKYLNSRTSRGVATGRVSLTGAMDSVFIRALLRETQVGLRWNLSEPKGPLRHPEGLLRDEK